MILKVTALERIKAGSPVCLLFNDSSQITCRTTLPSEPPDAIARRVIDEGATILFDSGKDTDDLLRPRAEHYRLYPVMPK